jgi:maltose alpha-D-glucosyltransferase/alpha-amylase
VTDDRDTDRRAIEIDTAQLLDLIPDRRWFGSKSRALTGATVLDHVVVDDGPPALAIAIAELSYAEGPSEVYNLPLLVRADGMVADITDDPLRAGVFGSLMVGGAALPGRHGTFRFGGPGLDPMAPAPGTRLVSVVGSEQSNTSLVLDDEVIVKLFRRLEPGPNPDLELNELLTSEGFEHVPAQVGAIYYDSDDDPAMHLDLGIAQQLITDGVDGWDETLEHIRQLYDEIHESDLAEDRSFLTAERGKKIFDAIEELGDATASMHVTLSREDINSALVPEPVTPDDLTAWGRQIESSMARAIERDLDELEGVERAVSAAVARAEQIADAGMKARIHGDFHLGQVMLCPRGWMILDFEGEPARPLEERRAKQSPLRDVAGILRSFSYAASSVLFERADPSADEWKRLEPWADAWEAEARERFLASYMTRAHEGRFLPPDRDDIAALLDVFEIDKALYEIGYELDNRPDWVRIPLRGIAQAINRGAKR